MARMDALSDVLSTINLSGAIFLRANMGGKYGISMPPPTVYHPIIKPHSPRHRLVLFHIVRRGTGYVQVEGYDPAPLDEGDLIIVFDDLFHSVVDSPGRECIPSSAGLRDPAVGKALKLMHSSPARDWTVQDLARAVGSSRSALSARFTELLDMAPMTYLTRWRIRVAMKLLESRERTIAEIAGLVGYETEPSFHRAFKRETGVPPATFRRQALGAPVRERATAT